MPKPVIPIRSPYSPELLTVVQFVVERILERGGDVFEFGSGFSTVWLAKFANVVSVEHDEEWYGEVLEALEREERDAVVHLVPEDAIPGVIDGYGEFDMVLVDSIDRQRVRAAELAMTHVRPGGWLLLDDSHWPMLAQARKLLGAWPCTVISGPHLRHNGQRRDHQTSFYRRPLDV